MIGAGVWRISVVVMAVVAAACATEAPMMEPNAELSLTPADRQANVIELEQAVYFQSPEGAPVAVPPGFYRVAAGGSKTLRLTPNAGGAPLMIAAVPSPQTYLLEQSEPVAVALPGDQKDTHHILLAQVDGAGLEAAGSYSGIQTRAPGLFVSPAQGRLYVETKAYTSSAQSRVTGPVEAGAQAPTLSASLTITPGPNVSYFQECAGLSGYVSSIVTMRIASLLEEDRPLVARGDAPSPRIVLTGNPVQSPPVVVPGGNVSYPNTPFLRVFDKNPYRCMFGSVTVSTRNLMAGGKVRLTMTVHDLSPGRGMTIADTYELPMTASGIVTFGKVVVSSVSLQGLNRNRTDETTFVINALRTRAPNGALVKIEASVDGSASASRDCLYKPAKGAAGVGTLTCK